MGSLRTLNPPAPKPSDRGQYLKVHLLCGQSISVSGSATENTLYGGIFKVDLYDGNQPFVTQMVNIAVYGTANYQSSTFVNPNSAASDFYIWVYCDYLNIQDFTISIASNEVNNPRPVAPDATGGSTPNSEEYRLPASIDTDVLTGRNTELWAKVYWPADFSGGPYPLVLFLHGNHDTCGRIGTSPRVDDKSDYTLTGACPAGYSVVNNHLGFEYLATQLASSGYIVASLNANRGITGAPNPDASYPDDPLHIFSRGRLVLKHLETLRKWKSAHTALITPTTLDARSIRGTKRRG